MGKRARRLRRENGHRMTGRDATLRQTDPPPAEVRRFFRGWVVSGWLRWWHPTGLALVAAGDCNRGLPADEGAFGQIRR